MSLKKLVILTIALALVAVPLASSALSPAHTVEAAPPRQDNTPQRTITVTGNGIAYGQPDVVTVALGVQSSNTDILTAMDDVTTRVQAVMQALSDAGIASDDMRTDNYSIYQDYGQSGPVGPNGTPAAPSYNVSMGLTITVRDTQKVGDLLAKAVSAGANMVNYIQFDIADRAALQSQARSQAVDDARSRAAELAGLLGLQVGEALSVTETSDYYTPTGGMGGGGGVAMAQVAPPISGGTLSVSMSVTITFALVPAS